ncbi:MAG: hypothetical protein IJB97_01720, partial [Clostridia bacterium]|nr:hypothetical protein [Clostridia bacterium]
LCVVGFIFSRSPVYSGKWTVKLGDFDAAFIIPSLFLGAAIYFVTAKVFTLIPISVSTCQKCFCYDCKLPTYKSDEKSWTETETETRDSYDSGTSVSFSDGSYATIGGGWSKESKSRAVHKQSWTQHLTCKWCGNQTNVQENDEQREKWSNWN